MHDVRIRLARRFRKQQEFSAGSSPLYHRLNGILADWLATELGSDSPVDWLVQAAGERSTFDVPLLLLAGLHREVLAGGNEVQPLARYYPSAGGTLPPDADDIETCLRQAIKARKEALAHFVATAHVQTNESARGFCWLLPVTFPGWKALHLVELGASAGLNLLADQRTYRLTDTLDGNKLLDDLGYGREYPFSVIGEGAFCPPTWSGLPAIFSRTGCDLAPLTLRSEQEEQTLASFVWPDQLERLASLRQGISVLQRVNQSANPVRLYRIDLPDELPRFLNEQIDQLTNAPVVLFNTYLTTYLREKGKSLRSHLANWALRRPQPVLWLQWETMWQGPNPPEFGWIGWTADLWMNGRHHHWHLAWTHPHGARIQWLPGWFEWTDFWARNR